MKPLIIIMLLLALMGCSTTANTIAPGIGPAAAAVTTAGPSRSVLFVTELGQQWTVGKQGYCVYKTNRLLCVHADDGLSVLVEMKAAYKKDSKIEDLLFANSVDFVLRVEGDLQDDERGVQRKVLNMKFSEKTDDHSIWNCVVTGLASPAMECRLVKQPDAKDKELILKKLEQDQPGRRASALLYDLTHRRVQERCGLPLQSTEDSLSVMELYKGNSKFLAFRFDRYQGYSLTMVSSMDLPPPKLDSDSMSGVWREGHGWLDSSRSLKYEMASAIWILQEMPCLQE